MFKGKAAVNILTASSKERAVDISAIPIRVFILICAHVSSAAAVRYHLKNVYEKSLEMVVCLCQKTLE